MLTSAFSVGLVWMNVLFVCWWDYYGTDPDIIVDLWEKGEDSVFRGAPHLVILTGPRGMGKHYVGRETHTIRMAYFELAAIPYNLGTVWAGFFLAAVQLWPPARKAIGLEKGEEAMDAMCIGYPKNLYRRIPQRNNLESLCDNCYLRELRPKLKS